MIASDRTVNCLDAQHHYTRQIFWIAFTEGMIVRVNIMNYPNAQHHYTRWTL
ncbi:MAG TPA: hypothetical protein PLJ60_12350 [Chryseolinea sp.]|nr:hypothetical protein [Chryseolinea sp.]HPM31115.1 hypothetical protein [Chryseolinea sp.]